MSSQFDVVEVSRGTDAEDADEFVLASIEGSLPGVGFRPDNKVQHVIINVFPSVKKLADVAPVDANVMNSPVVRHVRGRAKRVC